jgi:hypothetical protein
MPQQGDLSQTSPRQDDLVEYPGDHLYRDGLAAEAILSRDDEAVCTLAELAEELPSRFEVEGVLEANERVVTSV